MQDSNPSPIKSDDPLTLASRLRAILDDMHGHELSIGKMVDGIGDKSFGMALILLSMPSAIPLPAAGYSIPFGFCIAIIAIQMLIGRKKLGLPGRLRKVRLPSKFAEKMAQFSFWALKKIECSVKPRHLWVHGRTGHRMLSIAVLIMAIFMMIPIPGTNTLPAISVFVIGVSISEKDGLIALMAAFSCILAGLSSSWLAFKGIAKLIEMLNS